MATPAHTIEIEIDEAGNIIGEVQGLTGSQCSQVSEWLDRLGTVTKDEKTSDYFKAKKQAVLRNQNVGK